MPSYQYRKSHCIDKTVVRSFYLHKDISYTGKMASLYWIAPLVTVELALFQHLTNPGVQHFFSNIVSILELQLIFHFMNDPFRMMQCLQDDDTLNDSGKLKG